MFWIFAFSSSMALSALLLYLYYASRGQFEELEETKYQMFRDDDENPE